MHPGVCLPKRQAKSPLPSRGCPGCEPGRDGETHPADSFFLKVLGFSAKLPRRRKVGGTERRSASPSGRGSGVQGRWELSFRSVKGHTFGVSGEKQSPRFPREEPFSLGSYFSK